MQNTEEFEKEFDEYNEGRQTFKQTKEQSKKRFWFFGNDKEETQEPVPKEELQKNNDEELKQDLKDISRISFGMMQKLPKEELAKFKNSQEFHKFREILSKHKIIKG